MLYKYPALFKPDKKEGGFIITFRDIPEAITQADTVNDCVIEAADCLEEAIAGRFDDGLDIPEPSSPLHNECFVSTHVQEKKNLKY